MILRLALRNLRRAGWRTALAGAALTLATAVLAVTLALIEGVFAGMVGGATRRGDGDALIVRRAHGGGAREPIPDAAAIGAAARRLPGVAGVSPRLRIQALLLSGERRTGAEILGVDPVAEAGVTDLQRLLGEGRPLPSAGGDGVLLGSLLAARLGVFTGGYVTLLTRAADGLPLAERLTVTGVFATGDARRDGMLALAGIDRMASLVGLAGSAHEIGVSFVSSADAPRAAAAITAALPATAGLVAIPWQERLPALAAAVRFSRASSWWLIALFHAAAGLVLLIVLLLGMHERRREHAVWLALGAPAALLRAVIAAESLLLGAAAVAAGSLLGAAIAVPLGARGIDLSRFLGPIGYAGGTILPALRASFSSEGQLRSALTLLAVAALAGWVSGRRIAALKPARVVAGRDEG